MNNQPNQMVTLEWLLPIFNQQLSQISDGWQSDADIFAFKRIVPLYHQISGALIIANLPRLARFTSTLSLLATANHEALNPTQRRQGLFAHQLLQRELTRYVQTGHYHSALLDKTLEEIGELLSQMHITVNNTVINDSFDSSHGNTVQSFNISVPNHSSLPSLQPTQYQRLLLVWRQHVQQLLVHDHNEPIILTLLEKVANYLWKTTDVNAQQQLWYLTELWLHNLSNNQTPTPTDYAKTLAHLDQVISTRYQQVLNLDKQDLDKQTGKSHPDMDANLDINISTDLFDGLLADIYIQISGLKNLNAHTQTLLSELTQPTDITLRFLPRILTEIEVIIFALDKPKSLITPLKQLKKQLSQRGWVLYASQVSLILADIEQSAESKTLFAQMQWQIERQLQELYSAIYNTEQSIRTKIGEPTSFLPATTTTDKTSTTKFTDTLPDQPQVPNSAHDNLRQLRTAVDDVKHNFNDYAHRQQNYLLPTADVFVEIGMAFDDMGLPAVRDVTDKLGNLLGQIEAHKIQTLSRSLTQLLAKILISFELLLDGLAQQVFDQQILTQANEYIENAGVLVMTVIAAPDDVIDAYLPIKTATTDVVRYDDDGETIPVADNNKPHEGISTEADDDLFDKPLDSLSMADSEERLAARAQIEPDNFEIDEDIREIFMEDVDEVLADIQDPICHWQQDTENTSALIQVISGFHALQESGRMAGAFSISEMAWSIEKLLNRVLDKTLVATDDVTALLKQVTEALPVLLADYAMLQAPSINTEAVILQSNNLLAGQPIYQGMATSDTFDVPDILDVSDARDMSAVSLDTDSSVLNPQPLVTESPAVAVRDNQEQISDNKAMLPAFLAPFIKDADPLAMDTDDADPDIKEIFIEEAEEVLEEIVPLYEQWRLIATDLPKLTEIRRGFHTLKGSGRMVGAFYTAELAWSIEDMLNRILDHTISVSPDIIQLMSDVLSAYPELIVTFAQDTQDYPAVLPLWIACARAYSKNKGDCFSYAELRLQWLAPDKSTLDEQATGSVNTGLSIDDNLHADIYNDETPNHDTHITTQATQNNAVVLDEPTPKLTTDNVPNSVPKTEEEQEFCAIFIEEAQSLLQDIKQFSSNHQDQSNIPVSDDIVRAFHTLRAASGAGALDAISEVSTLIERTLEHLQQYDMLMTDQHVQAIAQSGVLIDGYLQRYEMQDSHLQMQPIADNQQQQDVASLQALLNGSGQPSPIKHNTLSVEQLLNSGIDGLLDADWQLHDALNTQDIEQINGYIQQQRQQIKQLSAQAIESPKFMLILGALDEVYDFLKNNLQAAQHPQVQAALLAGHEELVGLFDALAGSMSLKINPEVIENLQKLVLTENAFVEDKTTVISRQAREVEFEKIDTDPELLEIFLEEVQDINKAMTQTFNEWRQDIHDKDNLKNLQRYMHTITGGARIAGINSIADVTYGARKVYRALEQAKIPPTSQWIDIMQMVQDMLTQQINYLAAHHKSFFVTELIDQWREFAKTMVLPDVIDLIVPLIDEGIASTFSNEENTSVEGPSDIVYIDRLIAQSWPDGQPDPDILEVFLEEAEELIASSSKYLQQFLENDSDTSALKSLQRDLHTIKGGSRMVAANGIANLAHEMETVYEDLASHRRPATQMISKLLMTCHDWLADSIFILKKQVNPPVPMALITALQLFSKNPESLKKIPNESLHAQRNTVLAAQAKNNKTHITKNIDDMPSMDGSFAEQDQSAVSSEMVRISGDLIEHMINLSGESSINRARIDMGMSSLTYSLEEMGTTVQRLADQLRRMESELETQILSQIDDVLITNEDFDPLEMDQYSALNQLSKSLSESASDLIDINGTLLEKTKDSEGLLLQLSRTQTELQDGLMNSRMVPFSRITSRFERIVRQTANELNKSVDLTIINADDEMDRSILERITSPIEHMLRNAVDHGIDNVPTRLKAGKERTGHITLEVLREGSEVVIHLTDDGQGIDIEAVRKKAIAQGLIDEKDTSLTDLEVMQYIFSAGLTTTKKITQVSGRGVGMDVVISEIRQLGGVVSVQSEAGQGSRFTIRVPLTVAVTDALVVRVADRSYAIPLAQIERVIRINPEKLYDYYHSGATSLEIDDNDYRIRYLNEVLSGNKLNELMVSTNTSFPLIVIKNRSGKKLALHVDQIEGSRIEVVVKPLGKQLSHIAGISAATIMGNGSVMLILDLIALMRNAPMLTNAKKAVKIEHSSSKAQLTVLVVDDSVTVRKVTSRFLERQGFNVALAKDGIDAIEILQETTPDLILLDIEMPRMDGFEVAIQVRHNSRLRNIPIIMITSRTGEKHRERAFDIGVNDYMGKPFQENQLLEKIQALLGKEMSLGQNGQ